MFARSPHLDAGRKLGGGAGTAVAAAMLGHALTVALEAGPPVVLVGDAEVSALAPAGVRLQPQRGTGFGARFRNAVADAFAAGFERVVAIGADVPGLTAAVLQDAVARLEAGDDRTVVVGPSRDGGYYLIGFNRYDPRAFEDIPWHTRAVLARTRLALDGSRLSYLAPLTDADDAGSLRRAIGEIARAAGLLRQTLARLLAALAAAPWAVADQGATPRWTIALAPVRRGPPPAVA